MRVAISRCIQRTHDRAVEAVHDAVAGERDESHRALLAGLEAHRGAGRDVEPEAARGGAVERQRVVDLEEVKCEPTCTGRSPRFATTTRHGVAAGVEFDVAGRRRAVHRGSWSAPARVRRRGGAR